MKLVDDQAPSTKDTKGNVTKGHLISELHFDVLKFPKKTSQKFDGFLP